MPEKIDLHMHTNVSDGTDTPSEIVERVKEAGITLFSVTDHDATKGCMEIAKKLKKNDPAFIYGIEFSCKDEEGKYHVLGYGYDPDSSSMREIVEIGHSYRIDKLKKRLEHLEQNFGFAFSEEDKEGMFALNNPGKPHVGNLMVKYGYASSKEEAITSYINKCRVKSEYVRPEDAVSAVLKGGGIPILAHPCFGSGDELFVGEEMEKRLRKLIDFGLQGIEAFYSGFTKRLREGMLSLAEKYKLYVTAGSDYHGKNKLVQLGDNNLCEDSEYPEGLIRFLTDVRRAEIGEK